MRAVAQAGLAVAALCLAASCAPPPAPSWPGGIDIGALIARDFRHYDPDYPSKHAAYGVRLEALRQRLLALERGGARLPCSRQVLVEATYLHDNTASWADIARTLDRLEASFAEKDQAYAMEQSPEDSAWGVCYGAWFHRVDATVDALNRRFAAEQPPRYPLRSARVFGTPEQLVAFLRELQVSDIAVTGLDRRNPLGVAQAALSQLLFKPGLRAFASRHSNGLPLGEAYVEAYRRFLDETQDAETGYWGPWYRSGGALYKSADLSYTFHTVSYRRGEVLLWPRLIETTFAIRDLPYPYGWKHNGRYNAHNNYDVAVILRYGWPHMTTAQRERARAEIAAMLAWTLDEAMTPHGAFHDDPGFYSAPSDAYYYGISFLDAVGYWDRAKRFWTDAEFPRAWERACHIFDRLLELDHSSDSVHAAFLRLGGACWD